MPTRYLKSLGGAEEDLEESAKREESERPPYTSIGEGDQRGVFIFAFSVP
jgi:hypothetical protein